MPLVVISKLDDVLDRYGDRLAALSARDAKRICTMTLNSLGAKARTQVVRALISQTGIERAAVRESIKTHRATSAHLAFGLALSGDETNIARFALTVRWERPNRLSRARYQSVSAAPWNTRRDFPGAFMIEKWNKVYIRTQANARRHLRQVFGPNLARELTKDESLAAFQKSTEAIVPEIGRLVAGVLNGSIQLGGRGY